MTWFMAPLINLVLEEEEFWGQKDALLIATLLKPEHRAQLPGLHLVNPSAPRQEIPHPFLSRESQDWQGLGWGWGEWICETLCSCQRSRGIIHRKGVCILSDGFSHKEIEVFESHGWSFTIYWWETQGLLSGDAGEVACAEWWCCTRCPVPPMSFLARVELARVRYWFNFGITIPRHRLVLFVEVWVMNLDFSGKIPEGHMPQQ